MATPWQIRAARALLGWSQQELADRAVVSVNSVGRIETALEEAELERHAASHFRVMRALRAAGIEFLTRGEGVRFAGRPPPPGPSAADGSP